MSTAKPNRLAVYKNLDDAQPIATYSFQNLAEEAENPRIGPKQDAPVITPHNASGKRKEAAQSTEFYAVVVDHDDGETSRADIECNYKDTAYIAFTTSSHMQDGKGERWKVVLPLAEPLDADNWAMLAEGAAHQMGGDRAQARVQQVFYAPNKLSTNAPYEHIVSLDADYLSQNDALGEQFMASGRKIRAEQRESARSAPVKGGGGSNPAFQRINAQIDIGDVLGRHGYRKMGKRWMSPKSQSGTPGVVILDDDDKPRLYSHHGADDPLSSENHKGHALDALDVVAILDYGGDRQAAADAYRPADEAEPDLSHDSLALEASAHYFDENARYVAAWNRWMIWQGDHWDQVRKNEHMTILRDFLRGKAKRYVDWAKKKADSESDSKEAAKIIAGAKSEARTLRSDASRASVERMLQSNPGVVADADQWDSDLWLLGTPDGTVDLKTGERRPAQRGDYITKRTATTPSDTADCPQWKAFLGRIFRSNPEVIPFLQRATGYALTGQTTEHKLLFAFGSGRNGKGVFFNTLEGIMGDYSTVAASSTFLDSGADAHPTDLASLAGARMVTASELPPGKAWNESRIKSMTGGDPITARRMRQDFFTFQPQFTLFIAGNHMPSFRGIDEATRARVLLIPFAETIPASERDPDLTANLRGEWPEILRWAIDGALEWQRVGLNPPDSVCAASSEYLDDEDELGQFIAERLVEGRGYSVGSGDLYDAFKGWAEKRGMHAWRQKALSQALGERGYKKKRTRTGRVWLDIKVKDGGDLEQEADRNASRSGNLSVVR